MKPLLTHLELSVALSVLEHVQKELCTLLGPASLSPAELFGLKNKQLPVKHASNMPSKRAVNPHKLLRLIDSFHRLSKGVLRWSSWQLLTQVKPKRSTCILKSQRSPGHTFQHRHCSDGMGHTGA